MEESPGPPDRPFVGLRPFKTNEALIFFGRQRQIVELLERLHRTRFVGVIGSSGSGKSSLIYAGLVPALQAGFLVGDRDRWVVARMTPGDSPWLRLSDALHAALCKIGLDPTTDIRGTAELGGVSGLLQVMASCLQKANANLLLFVDQFEEIFRRDDDRTSEQHEEDTDFVSVVLGLAHQREVPVFVVFTMRSDHLGDCDEFLGLPEALNESQYLVPRLNRDEVRLAIEGPIRLFQKDVAPRLVDRLLNDLGGQHDQLPVLQHALMRMWVRLLESGQPTMDLEHYRDVGMLADALRRHADEALAGLDPAVVHAKEAVNAALDALDPQELRFFQVAFQALTDTDHANRKVRRWQSVRGLRELTGQTLPELHRLLERFVDDRRSFLRYSGEGGSTGPDATLVDISHESLIRQWDRLRAWVQEEAQNRDTYVRIRDDARRWEAGAGSLWEDPGLAQARLWWDRCKPSPLWARRYGDGFAAADSFLRESEKRRDREVEREKEEIQKEKERNELRFRNKLMRRTHATRRRGRDRVGHAGGDRDRAVAARAGRVPARRVERARGLGALGDPRRSRAEPAPRRAGRGEGRHDHVGRRAAGSARRRDRPQAVVGAAAERVHRLLQPRRPPARGGLGLRRDAGHGGDLGRGDRDAAGVALRPGRDGGPLDAGRQEPRAGAGRRQHRRVGRRARRRLGASPRSCERKTWSRSTTWT